MAVETIAGATDALDSELTSDSRQLRTIPRIQLPDETFGNNAKDHRIVPTPEGELRTGTIVSKDGAVGGNAHNVTAVE